MVNSEAITYSYYDMDKLGTKTQEEVVEKLKLFCKINKSIIDEVIIKIPV